jgi:hypothetical protein
VSSLKQVGTRLTTSRIVHVAVAVALMLAVSSSAIAQTNAGEVSGVVKDISGGVLPGASVTARHAATGTVVEG